MLFGVRSHSIYSYYLLFLISCSENTKNVLLSSAFVHMEKKDFIKQFSEISSINQRILLSGPAGTFFVVAYFFRIFILVEVAESKLAVHVYVVLIQLRVIPMFKSI